MKHNSECSSHWMLFDIFIKRTITNETTAAMIAKSKVKQNGPTFCNIVGGYVDRDKQIDPRTADNMRHYFLCNPTKKWGTTIE